jgi:phage protein D
VTPFVQVSIDGSALNGFDKRAIGGEIIEHDGEHADQVHITVSNYDGKLQKPARGKKISVAVGSKEHGIIKAGTYTVTEVAKTGPRAEFHITGHAADLGKTLKKQKTRSWKAPKTYGDVFNDLAQDNQLTPRVDGAIAGKTIEKIVAQTGESDMHLATRLARMLGAICKVGDGNLVVVPKGAGTTASGGQAGSMTVTPNDLEGNFSIAERDRPKRGKVKATHYDRSKAARNEIASEGGDSGDDAPDYAFPQIFGTKTEAQQSANGRKGEFSRAEKGFAATLRTGLYGVAAGGTVTTQGFGDDDDQDWTVKRRIIHFDQHGVLVRLQCETKKGSGGGT